MPEATTRAARAGVPGEWRSFGAFLRRPTLPDRADLSLGAAARAIAPLLLLDMALMAVVLGGITLAASLGFQMPEHMLDAMKLDPLMIGFIVIGAPIAEEALFRGWLSGRAGHVLAVVALLVGGAALLLAGPVPAKLAGLGGGLLVAAAALFLLRQRPAMGFFQNHFAWFYFVSALLFAAIHLTNFSGGGFAFAQLPLVVPQLVLGLILGYLRVNRGLLASIILHMLHNSVFAALMVLGASAA